MKAWTDEECDSLRDGVQVSLGDNPPGRVMRDPFLAKILRERALIRAAVDEARREEREACAELARCCHGAGSHTGPQEIIAAAILARSEVPR